MILTKPFCSLLLLACLISIVFAQTPTATESNSTESNSSEIKTSSTASVATNITESSSIIIPTSSSSSISPFSTINISTTSNNANALPTVQPTGWNSNGNSESGNQQSWLRQNNRFVFVIFLGLIFMAVLIWYIVRSVKAMRKRLEQENQAQLYMMQQATSPPPPPPPPAQQRNDRVIPELMQTPPPAYKTEENTPNQPHY